MKPYRSATVKPVDGVVAMAYVAQSFTNNPIAPFGTWVGAGDYYGECVSFAKAVTPGLPQTARWRKGAAVKGMTTLAAGTVIATFDQHGRYRGHAAIYEGQDAVGLNVVDQWITPPPKPIGRRKLKFGALGVSNDGNMFHVVD